MSLISCVLVSNITRKMHAVILLLIVGVPCYDPKCPTFNIVNDMLWCHVQYVVLFDKFRVQFFLLQAMLCYMLFSRVHLFCYMLWYRVQYVLLNDMLPCTVCSVTCYASMYSRFCYMLFSHWQYVLLRAMLPCTVCSITCHAPVYSMLWMCYAPKCNLSVTCYVPMYNMFCYMLCSHVQFFLLHAILHCTVCSVICYAPLYSMFCYMLCSHVQYVLLHVILPSTVCSVTCNAPKYSFYVTCYAPMYSFSHKCYTPMFSMFCYILYSLV